MSAADVREVLRVLKPGGRLAVVAETYQGKRSGALSGGVMKLLGGAYLSPSEHRDLFTAAGYFEIVVDEERAKGWLCVVGRRPLLAA